MFRVEIKLLGRGNCPYRLFINFIHKGTPRKSLTRILKLKGKRSEKAVSKNLGLNSLGLT